MPVQMSFSDPRLASLNGFTVEIDEANERADIILHRPPQPPVQICLAQRRDADVLQHHLPIFEFNRYRRDPLAHAVQLIDACRQAGKFKIQVRIGRRGIVRRVC